jgi:hypothetical protein
MKELWSERKESITDRSGAAHALQISPYDNTEADPAAGALAGPFGAFGLHAHVGLSAGPVDVWLICNKSQLDYLTGESERIEKVPIDRKVLDARCKQVFEDFAVKVKLALRSEQVLPNDEIHIRLGPDVRVPPYGPDWRRALREE